MFDERTVKQNSFTRNMSNDAKAGAYYTDLRHSKSIRSFFNFPEEYCVLEPSIGDASAVLEATVPEGRKLFGVELQTEVANATKEKCEALLNADFLNGVKITNSAFPFCFANPPYGTDVAKQERYERLFLEKLFSYLKLGARLVYIIPLYVLTEPTFYKFLLSRFKINYLYKFREPTFQQFKQVVIFGTKKAQAFSLKEDAEKFLETINNGLEELPVEFTGEKLDVLPCEKSEIKMFATQRFDYENAASYLKNAQPYRDSLGKLIFNPPYMGNEIDSPLMPLKDDMNYLLAVCGAGQGFAGSEETNDLHLQRGCVKRVNSQSVEVGTAKGRNKLVEKSYSTIKLTVIEPNGAISVLSDGGKEELTHE